MIRKRAFFIVTVVGAVVAALMISGLMGYVYQVIMFY